MENCALGGARDMEKGLLEEKVMVVFFMWLFVLLCAAWKDDEARF